jgi:ectoine hydroxylase-related dioxygenase (phytanoyl-CoA dioxygenase family)
MTPDQILAYAPRVLTQAQRESYFEQGYLLLERLIDAQTIDSLNATTAAWIERSRALEVSSRDIDVAADHTQDNPKVRRLIDPDRIDSTYWTFATGVIADVAADLVGPNVVFNHSKLNFKWSGGRDEVKWHQDIPFYPHTNHNVLAIGCYLSDVAMEDGPLGVIPGSHRGRVFEHYNERGTWTGAINDGDLARVALESAAYLPGPKGSITVHHSRAIHGSKPTTHSNGRPLLINAYAAADAFPYHSPESYTSPHNRATVRGERARWAHLDPEPCPMPPEYIGGYKSIYAYQSGEAAKPTPRDPGPRPAVARPSS